MQNKNEPPARAGMTITVAAFKWLFFALTIALCLLAFENDAGARAEYVFIGTPVVILFYTIFLVLDRKNPRTAKTSRTWEWAFWISAIWLLPWSALRLHFGAFEIHAALFHMQEGLGSSIHLMTVLAVLCGTVIVVIGFHAILVLARLLPWPWLPLTPVIAAVLFINPLNQYMLEQQFRASASDNLLPDLVDPVILSAPADPPNLIIIYLEGMERTYGTAGIFGPVYDPIFRLEDEATVFEGVGQLPLTEWSIAGVVASQCGVPLVPRGFFQRNRANDGASFMPQRTCLTDILANHGFNVEFMTGGDKTFAGMDAFVASHGDGAFFDFSDLTEMPGRDTDDWHWGVSDANLFRAAMTRVEVLAASDQPYSVILQTVGPHGPTGHIAAPCLRAGESSESSDILRPVECTASLTEAFIRDLQATVDMDNTLIVIMSDHLAHRFVNVSDSLAEFERRNTFMLLGAGTKPGHIAKTGTMIDVFPTILAAMGFELAKDKAGFGVSLLSDQPSNFLDIDPEALMHTFRQNIPLLMALWGSN